MPLKPLAIVAGLMGGLGASQFPEFTQQYSQRLGGAVDEMARIFAEFDADAARHGMSRAQGIERLARNPDSFVSDRGARLREDSARLARLERQLSQLQNAGPLNRLAVIVREVDPQIARRVWDQFQPAVPVTSEGAILTGAGFLGGWGLWRLIAFPFRRRRPAAGAFR